MNNKQLTVLKDKHSAKCTCEDEIIEEHTCPYSEDVNNDFTTMCNCCAYCQHNCLMDI